MAKTTKNSAAAAVGGGQAAEVEPVPPAKQSVEQLRASRAEFAEMLARGERQKEEKINAMNTAIQLTRDALGEIDAELARRGVPHA